MSIKKDNNKLELLKKYWFVGLVCIALLVFVVMYTVDEIKNKPIEVTTKQSDGHSVIFDVDDDDYLADDLYADLYASTGINREYNKFVSMVLDAAYETTSDLENQATAVASNFVSQYGEDYVNSYLLQNGYTNGLPDLTKFIISSYKNIYMLKDYYEAHYDEVVPGAIEQLGLKSVEHILVKVAEVEETTDESGKTIHVAKPTADEKAKLDKVLEELKTKSFEDVAKEYSDDGSAANGGLLGVYSSSSANSTFVKEFAEACVNTPTGSVSEVITSQYGYHIVKVDEPTKDQILQDQGAIEEISNATQDIYINIIMAKAEEVGFEIYDEELKRQIDAAMKGDEQ